MTYAVRCTSCQKPLRWPAYLTATANALHGLDPQSEESLFVPARVMDQLGYTRECCRRMFLSDCEYNQYMFQYHFTKEELALQRVTGIYHLSQQHTNTLGEQD